MNDIVPELLADIQEMYEAGIRGSRALAAVKKKIEKGTATYADGYTYAKEVGQILAAAYDEYITADTLPDGRMYYNIAKRVLEPTMKAAYEEVAAVCMEIQNRLNEKAGIGIKAVKPERNQENIDSIIDSISAKEEYEVPDERREEPAE